MTPSEFKITLKTSRLLHQFLNDHVYPSSFEEHNIDALEDLSPAGFYNLGICLDDEFPNNLDQLHYRLIKSRAESLLTQFQAAFYVLTEELLCSDEPVEAAHILTDLINTEIASKFNYFYQTLNVNSKKELNLLIKVLHQSYNLLIMGLENNEVEYIIESYYNLNFKLTYWGLLIPNKYIIY